MLARNPFPGSERSIQNSPGITLLLFTSHEEGSLMGVLPSELNLQNSWRLEDSMKSVNLIHFNRSMNWNINPLES